MVLSWAFQGSCLRRYLLSQHKEAEEKVMAELHALQDDDAEIKSGTRGIGYEDLRRLPYLQAVIKVRNLMEMSPF